MPLQHIDSKNISLDCIDDPDAVPWDDAWERWMLDENESESGVRFSNGGVSGWMSSLFHPQSNRLSALLVAGWRRLGWASIWFLFSLIRFVDI
jgi:hypothetical protein